MNHLNKGNAKYILLWALTLLLFGITPYCTTSGFNKSIFHSLLTTDTIPVKPSQKIQTTEKEVIQAVQNNTNSKKDDSLSTNNLQKADTNIVAKTDTFSFRTSKGALDAPVVYHADDSMVMDVPTKKIILYGKQTKVSYIDNVLTSPRIEFDQATSLVSAYLIKDSVGNVIAFPEFNQADFKTKSDSIKFNMKTGKGITKGTYTQQGELFVYGEKIKKVSPDIFYAFKGRFTTCNLDTPHFSFVSKRIKFINKKMAITGPVHPEFENVPIPIVLPFGIYPLQTGRHSGLLAPSFSANESLGLSLERLGYYKVLGEKWDLVTMANIYSYGGWTATINPRYYKRYRYQGNFAVNIIHLRDLDKSGARAFKVNWQHSTDTKARPGVTFSAFVDAGSSGYNSSIPNNNQRNFQNQLQSTISYSKVWKNKPFNININANHNQNGNTKLINIALPSIGFNVNTIYPFRRKEVIGSYKWYENLGLALNTTISSLSSFYDTTGNFFNQFAKNYKYGANHNVPITLSLPQIGYFQFAPSVTYQERWYQEKFERRWDTANKKLDTIINKGFYTAREMTFGMGVTTRIFGMFTFGKKSKIEAIRHELRPNFSINYKPDMNRKQYYYTQIDTTGRKFAYSYYERGIAGPFAQGKFGGISFGLDNVLQMKLRNNGDSTKTSRKITLIDGLSINSSYNFLDDSFKLKPFNVYLRTNLFDKISISGSAIFVPYRTNSNGDFIDKLIWTKQIALGKLTNATIAVQTSFKGGDQKEQLPNNNLLLQKVNPISGLPINEYEQEAAYIQNNPGEFANFNIPWSISFSYAFSYNRIPRIQTVGYTSTLSQDVTWNGTLNLTPKWQIGMNGSYNISQKELGMISMYLTREMHCWQMSINVSPVGKFRSFNISISPKSGLLRDLKINRTRYFYDL